MGTAPVMATLKSAVETRSQPCYVSAPEYWQSRSFCEFVPGTRHESSYSSSDDLWA